MPFGETTHRNGTRIAVHTWVQPGEGFGWDYGTAGGWGLHGTPKQFFVSLPNDHNLYATTPQALQRLSRWFDKLQQGESRSFENSYPVDGGGTAFYEIFGVYDEKNGCWQMKALLPDGARYSCTMSETMREVIADDLRQLIINDSPGTDPMAAVRNLRIPDIAFAAVKVHNLSELLTKPRS